MFNIITSCVCSAPYSGPAKFAELCTHNAVKRHLDGDIYLFSM